METESIFLSIFYLVHSVENLYFFVENVHSIILPLFLDKKTLKVNIQNNIYTYIFFYCWCEHIISIKFNTFADHWHTTRASFTLSVQILSTIVIIYYNWMTDWLPVSICSWTDILNVWILWQTRWLFLKYLCVVLTVISV